MQPNAGIPPQNLPRNRSDRNAPNLIEEVFRLYDRALAAASNGIVIADATLPDRPLVYCNPAFEKITGYTSEEIIGRNCRFLQGPDTDPATLGEIRSALEEQRDCKVVLKNYRKDGTPFWNELTISPVRDAEGRLTHFIGVQADITKRKEAEFALQQAEAKYRSIFENATEGIFQTAPDGRFLSANPALARIYGYDSPEEMIAKCTAQKLYVDLARRSEFMRAIAKKGALKNFESAVYRKDDSTIWIEENVREVRGSRGELLYYEGTVADISDVYEELRLRKQAEAAVRDSEKRFRAIFERGAIGMVVANLEGLLIATNPAFQVMLDCTETELLGAKLSDLTHPDDVDRDRDLSFELAAGVREAYQCEKRFLRKDGSVRWGCLSLSFMRNSQGKPQFLLGMIEDITERKQAEEALSQNEAKWRSMIQNSSDIITIIDAQGKINYESPSVETILGYEPEELIGQFALNFVPPEDIPAATSYLKKLTSNPADPIPFECRFRRVNGSWCFLETIGINLLEDSAVKGIVLNSREVTGRKQAEYRLSKINECFLGFGSDGLENIHHLTALAGELLGGACALYNRLESGLLRSVGQWQTPPDFQAVDRPDGHICYDAICQGTDKAVVFCDLQQTIYAQTDPCVAQYQLQTYIGQAVRLRDIYVGSVCVVYTESVIPTEADRKLIGIIAVAIAVEEERATAAASERQKSQQLETALLELQQTQVQLIQTEKMSSLGQMLAGIAHEINNPVSFVTGNLSHVNDYIKDLLGLVKLYQNQYPNSTAEIEAQTEAIDLEFLMEDLPKLLDSMKMGTKRIVEIVHNIRNFSRLDEAQMKLADVHEGLDSTLLILNNRIKGKPGYPAIQIVKEYGNLPLVHCYPGQLNQVFMNILANAIDALEEVGVKQQQTKPPIIKIQTEVIDSSICIRIKDNGSGIPQDTILRLFDPFFTTKPMGKGTGLGLSISHQIITEKHGGQLRCLSEPGEGTEFIIEIPIR